MECPYCFKKFKLQSRFNTHVDEKICFKYMTKQQKETLNTLPIEEENGEEVPPKTENEIEIKKIEEDLKKKFQEEIQKLQQQQIEKEEEQRNNILTQLNELQHELQTMSERYHSLKVEKSILEDTLTSAENELNIWYEYVQRVKQENIGLIQKLHSPREVEKVKKKDKVVSKEIKESIISILLNSPLNLPNIPDEIEELMYMSILDTLIDYSSKCCSRWNFFKKNK